MITHNARASISVDNFTSVRADGLPLCSTGNSASLDSGGEAHDRHKNRAWAAMRIALCWNACRHLSDAELERGVQPVAKA